MAIFEKKYERKLQIDDTEKLSCTIETAQKVNGHTEYLLKVQRGYSKENSWRIFRRYNDFVELHKRLQSSGFDLPLPAKKYFGNMRPEFIAERRLALQEFMNFLLLNPVTASSPCAKQFLDPDNYNHQSSRDKAIQNASLCLRVDGLYALGTPVIPQESIGWRLKRFYFNVMIKSSNLKKNCGTSGKNYLKKSSSQSQRKLNTTNGSATVSDFTSISSMSTAADNSELVLAWTEYDVDRYISDKEMMNVLKSISTIQHPFIYPIEYVATNDNGALFIRKFNTKGSLKDLLCCATPKNTFMVKYNQRVKRIALPIKDIAMYGRQILEAIKFLHSKGLPYGHTHAGNVAIIDGVAKLLDIENFALGSVSFYRPYFIQLSKINTVDLIEVYCFGHFMFELSMGYTFQDSFISESLDYRSESLKNLIESILSKDAFKVGLPTLDQLVNHRFFTENAPKFNDVYTAAINITKPHFKLSTIAKDEIRVSIQKMEQRLREEQIIAKNQKRLVKVQDLMNSEEVRKIIKQKAKHEYKQSKLRQQNSLQLNNVPQAAVGTPLARSDSIQSVSTSQDTLSPPPTTLTKSDVSSTPLSPPPIPQTSKPSSSSSSSNNPSISQMDSHSLEIDSTTNRSALLNAICGFNKMALRKVASTEK